MTKNGEIVITSQTSRDAPKNKAECLRKLKTMLIKALKKPKRRIPTKPTRGSIERRLEAKRCNARKKENRRVQE